MQILLYYSILFSLFPHLRKKRGAISSPPFLTHQTLKYAYGVKTPPVVIVNVVVPDVPTVEGVAVIV